MIIANAQIYFELPCSTGKYDCSNYVTCVEEVYYCDFHLYDDKMIID